MAVLGRNWTLIVLCILITLPCLKCCSAELPLKAGSYVLWCRNIWNAYVWAPPLMEDLHYSASNAVMWSKYATEQCSTLPSTAIIKYMILVKRYREWGYTNLTFTCTSAQKPEDVGQKKIKSWNWSKKLYYESCYPVNFLYHCQGEKQ